jgi:hypothetical protein
MQFDEHIRVRLPKDSRRSARVQTILEKKGGLERFLALTMSVFNGLLHRVEADQA